MTVLNGQRHLAAAVESILNQTHRDFRFIAVNNGSQDGTGEMLDRYAAADGRMEVLRNEATVTYGEARAQAIALADTEWIALMDADDVSEQQRLERQAHVIAMHGEKLCALGTWARYINDTGRTLGQCVMQPTTLRRFERMYRDGEPIALVDPSAMIHRPTFLAVGGYRAEAAPAADLDLWYRMAERGRAILVLGEMLLKRRIHAGGESVRKAMLQRKKTHFINYNMRLRRSGRGELSWQEYLDGVWASAAYRAPRLRSDLALTFYKKAGMHFGAGNFGRCVLNMLGAGLIRPAYVANRLLFQKVPLMRRLAG
jgi:glycosyltransferase involved in cell wall biosynthesis